MRKTLRFVACVCAAGLGLAALTFSRSVGEPADLTYVSGAEPKSLDPSLMTGQLEGRFADAMYEGLTYLDPETQDPMPGVAERWETSVDEREWTFHLRKNARWSNGDPVTAQDFVWSWKRTLTPAFASEYSYMLWDIENAEAYNRGEIDDFGLVGVKALDDYTLRVNLRNAVPYFLDLTAFYTLYPVHRATVERWEADPSEPPGSWTLPGRVVTNGPFVLESWRVNDRIRLRKNPLYWDAASIRLETVDALSIEDVTAALNAFLVGEADWNPANWDPALNREIRQLPECIVTEAAQIYYYRINTTRPHLKDPRVRRALSMAIDRSEIVRNITRLGEKEAFSFVPPGIKGYVQPPGIRFDPEGARRLLAEAGYPGGKGMPPLELLYNTHEGHKATAVVIAGQLRENLGLDVRPFNEEWQSYQSSTQTLKYDLARAGWIPDYLDPNTFLDMWITDGGNNQTGYSSPLYDRLYRIAKDVAAFCDAPQPDLYEKLFEGDVLRAMVDEVRSIPKSDTQRRLARQRALRMQVFREMDQLVSAIDCPILPLYYYVTKNLVKPHVGGFHAYLRGPGGERVPNVRDHHPLRGMYIRRGSDAP
jgi:oligopeptide transport system substrate-binding protein